MSRSNPTENAVNPSSKFIEWSGSEGKFKYYDKEKKEILSQKKYRQLYVGVDGNDLYLYYEILN